MCASFKNWFLKGRYQNKQDFKAVFIWPASIGIINF